MVRATFNFAGPKPSLYGAKTAFVRDINRVCAGHKPRRAGRALDLAGGALERLERIIRHAMELPYLLAALLRTSILLCAMALAKAGLRVAEKTAAVVAWVLSPPDRV